MDVLEAIIHRRSVRAYLDKPLAEQTIRQVLEAARFAPSGVNTQPWKVVVVGKELQQQIGDAIIAKREAKVPEHPDYRYYPSEWFSPYTERRKACGLALYGALNIGFQEHEKRKSAWYRNYYFFGAPVGLLFFIDARLEKGSWMDVGIFLQNVMLAARGLGLETCPQAALAEYPDIVRDLVGMELGYHLICGMAMGYADWAHPINQYRTERLSVDEFTTWRL